MLNICLYICLNFRVEFVFEQVVRKLQSLRKLEICHEYTHTPIFSKQRTRIALACIALRECSAHARNTQW